MNDPTRDPDLRSSRRRTRFLMAGFVLATATSAAVVGCAAQDDASALSPSGRPDAGTLPPGDGSTAAPDAGPSIGPPRMVAINASPDLFEFRLCFAVSDADGGPKTYLSELPAPSDEAHPMPRTNYPGVASLNGAPIDLPAALSEAATITPYVVDARVLYFVSAWKSATCAELFASPQDFKPNDEYIELPSFPASALVRGRTTALIVSGCRPRASHPDGGVFTPNAQRCGESYSEAFGNIRATTVAVSDRPPFASTSSMNAQFLQLATGLGSDARIGATIGPVTSDAGIGDADAPRTLSNSQKLHDPPSLVTQVALFAEPDASDLTPFVTHGIAVYDEGNGSDAGALPLVVDFESIQRISSPTTLPSTYFANGNYLFALLGDPSDPSKQLRSPDGGVNTAFDGTGLHIVAVPVTRPADAGSSF